MPRSRIPVFEKRLTQLCEEAGLPVYDEYKYEALSDCAYFLWYDPEFCIGVPLATAGAFGLSADGLLQQWERKFGRREAA